MEYSPGNVIVRATQTGGEPMKEIEISLNLRMLPKQTDVRWIEAQLLRMPKEVFMGGREEGEEWGRETLRKGEGNDKG